MAIKKQVSVESMRGPARNEDGQSESSTFSAPVRSTAESKSFGLLAICLFSIGTIVVLGLGYYFYHQYTLTPAYQQAQAATEAKDVVAAVGKLMLLPVGEDPAIFNVADPSSLSAQQAFFAGSIKGDKLLVYQKSQKAIIYSPSRNIIVNVGPITADSLNKTPVPVTAVPTATTSAPIIKKVITPVQAKSIITPIKPHK